MMCGLNARIVVDCFMVFTNVLFVDGVIGGNRMNWEEVKNWKSVGFRIWLEHRLKLKDAIE